MMFIVYFPPGPTHVPPSGPSQHLQPSAPAAAPSPNIHPPAMPSAVSGEHVHCSCCIVYPHACCARAPTTFCLSCRRDRSRCKHIALPTLAGLVVVTSSLLYACFECRLDGPHGPPPSGRTDHVGDADYDIKSVPGMLHANRAVLDV